ncbi:F0F1 ATP synthase subunit delta [Rhodanobacter ginsengisoli]|uniref:ATP synthase subunit b n=1 Tax=Rhodanobacter ginsengisoli TaxID=418646 RepID=A0ABW0QMB1_9GAMM
MLIDWFTVGAQLLNFLILVWLMKRFLYKPILNAIDAREKRIAKELADAEAKRAEAGRQRDEFQRRNDEFDRQRAALLDKATGEANAERQRLLEEARKAADLLDAKRQQTMRRDAENLGREISRRTSQEVFSIARKTLADLASTTLEAAASTEFVRRLRTMDGAARTSLAAAIASATGPALVRSAFELPPAQRAAIEQAFRETFATDMAVQFETAADLVGGIELRVNGQRVAWSIDAYLASLQDAVAGLLESGQPPGTGEPAAPGESTPATGSP